MNKKQIVDSILAELQSEVSRLETAARAAYEGAVHSESQAEDKYDTRGLEASYLAGAQANRVRELRASMGVFRAMPLEPFQPDDVVRPAALVCLDSPDREPQWVLIALAGGGITVEHQGAEIRVVTAHSPLGQALLGKELDDDIELRLPAGPRYYEITAVL